MKTTVVVALGQVDLKTFTSYSSNPTISLRLLFNRNQNFIKYVVHLKVLFSRENEVKFQNSTSNKSRREREKRHLCGPVAPGLQHVV